MSKNYREKEYNNSNISSTPYDEKDPILCSVPNYLVDPIKLKNANIYVEGCISSDRTRYYVKQILDLYGLTDRFQICVRGWSNDYI